MWGNRVSPRPCPREGLALKGAWGNRISPSPAHPVPGPREGQALPLFILPVTLNTFRTIFLFATCAKGVELWYTICNAITHCTAA